MPEAGFVWTNALTIERPAADVWPCERGAQVGGMSRGMPRPAAAWCVRSCLWSEQGRRRGRRSDGSAASGCHDALRPPFLAKPLHDPLTTGPGPGRLCDYEAVRAPWFDRCMTGSAGVQMPMHEAMTCGDARCLRRRSHLSVIPPLQSEVPGQRLSRSRSGGPLTSMWAAVVRVPTLDTPRRPGDLALARPCSRPVQRPPRPRARPGHRAAKGAVSTPGHTPG